MSDRLFELLTHYRKGRDAFDSLVLAVTELYGQGALLPAVESDDVTLSERLRRLTPEQVEVSLQGRLPTELVSREEYRELLEDITQFIKEWLADADES